MKWVLVFLVFAIPVSGDARSTKNLATHKDSIELLQNIIRDSRMLHSENVGFTGGPSRVWYSFALLSIMATPAELARMATDRSPALRAYAYVAMSYTRHARLDAVRRKMAADHHRITVLNGCLASETTVSEAIADPARWGLPERLDDLATQLRNDRPRFNELFNMIVSGRLTIKT